MKRHPECPTCGRPLAAHTLAPLTKRQAEIFGYLREFFDAHGYAPSFDEIRSRFELRSTATVSEHLDNLERKGYIVRSFNESRGIALLRAQQGSPALVTAGASV